MKNFVIATALSLCVAAPAFAARSGNYYDPYDSRDHSNRNDRISRSTKMYIGISGGQQSTDIPNLSATSTNTSSTAYSVFAGYSFNDYFAAELAYANFGSIDLITPTDTMKSSAGSLSAVASMPLGRVASLFIKGGYASTTTEVTSSGVVLPSDSTSGGTYGAGIQFNAGRSMGIRIGYDTYRMLVGTTNHNANVASLGVMFKF
jgi:opacity protein-like surface antigen